MILVVLLYAILAATFIFAKNTLAYCQPFFLIGFRMLLAGSILIAYQFITNKKALFIKSNDIATFFKVSLFHIYFAFILEFWSLQYLTALKTTLIYSSTPFIAALIAYILLKERLSSKKVLGIVIGLGGLLPVLLAQTRGEGVMGSIFSISVPEIVLFFAVISSAYAWFIVSDLMKKGYGLVTINGISMLVGGMLSFITSLIFEGMRCPVTEWTPFLGWLTLLIISANFIVYNFYGWLLKRYSITFITFAGFLCPSFGTFYEWLFLGGIVTWHYFLSLGLVTLGLYIFHRDELKRNQNNFHGPEVA